MSRLDERISQSEPKFEWTPTPEMRGLGRHELHQEFRKAHAKWHRRKIRRQAMNGEPLDPPIERKPITPTPPMETATLRR